MIKKPAKIISYFTLIVLASGCSRLTTSPVVPFNQVQHDVCRRTGRLITWNKSQNSCVFQEWLENTLKEELTLDGVIQIALLNNPNLKAAYENLGIAQAQIVQANLLKNPIFSLSLKYENLVDSAHIIEMGLVQNFLDILLKPLKKKLAYAELAMVKSEIAAQVLDVIAETTIAYHMLQADQQVSKIQSLELETMEATYEAAKRLHDAGNVTELFLTVEHSNYENMKIDLLRTEVDVFESRERLNVLMGLCNDACKWKLAENVLTLPDCPQDWSCIETQAIANSLDLQIARQRITATALRLGIEVAEIIFPDFTLGIESEKDPVEPWFIGPQLSLGIPIFDMGWAKRASNRAELSKLWHQYYALAVQIRSSARSARFRLLKGLEQYNAYQQVIVPLDEQIIETALKQLNAMQIGVFELLEMKKKEIVAKRLALRSYKDFWKARTEIETLLNGRMVKLRDARSLNDQ
jgi:outer membrane protein, heavy metal efflux system